MATGPLRLPAFMSGTRLRLTLASFLVSVIAGTGCDLSTKAWAEGSLSGGPQPVIEPWLGLKLAYNRGTAFSAIPNLGDHMWVFAALAFAIAVGILVFVVRRRPRPLESIALGSIVAGAIGNGFDRAFRDAPGGGTGVVDFIAVTLPGGMRWPTFNVADALLVVGVGLLVVIGIASARRAGADAGPLEAASS